MLDSIGTISQSGWVPEWWSGGLYEFDAPWWASEDSQTMASRRRRYTPGADHSQAAGGLKSSWGQGVELPGAVRHLDVTEATWYR